MKTLATLLLILGFDFLRADDSAQNAKWTADFDKSVDIAGKLYPDILKSDSDLFIQGEKCDDSLKATTSPLSRESCKPLVIAIVTASKLNISANWNALSDEDKYMTFLALSYAASISKDFNSTTSTSSSVAPWSRGDDLGTITTNGGTVYSSAKLESVDPEGITILDSDGGAKISFDKLPPDLQKRFGYNPQNAAAYAQNQAAQNQIDQLTEENAKLRSALSRYKGAFEETQATPKVGIEAFHVYLYQTVVSFPIGSYARRNDVLTDGPWAGLTQDEAMTKAQQQWTQMSDDQKAPYEKMAQQTGDPILQKRADDAAKPAQFIPGPIIEN